ncbi:SRPBCC family protein [Flavitalea antarctica]
MKVLKIIGLVILGIIVLILVAAIFAPKTVHLEREITINTTPEKIWPLVANFRNHTKWSPFIKRDPNVVLTYEGRDATVGSVYAWEGNSEVGSGRQTMTKLEEPVRVESHLNFIEPFEGEADAFMVLTPVGPSTKTVWGFDSRYPYPMNAMLLFMDFDDMLGKDYSDGLANLKELAEKQ